MDLIKTHWPTRYEEKSKRVFNVFLTYLRFDLGCTFDDIYQMFESAVGIARWQFEDYMQEMGDY